MDLKKPLTFDEQLDKLAAMDDYQRQRKSKRYFEFVT